jgi:hypothetical protein
VEVMDQCVCKWPRGPMLALFKKKLSGLHIR